MQQLVAGITGIDESLVVPRWQDEPVVMPPTAYVENGQPGVNAWAAVGVTRTDPLGYSYNAEINPGAAASRGYQRTQDWEDITVLCSFYGPRADYYALIIREGLIGCAQNRECLQILNFGFQRTSGRANVPTLIKGRWLNRIDITLYFNRQIMLSAPFDLRPSDLQSLNQIGPTPGLHVTASGVTVDPGYTLFVDGAGNLSIRTPVGSVIVLVTNT